MDRYGGAVGAFDAALRRYNRRRRTRLIVRALWPWAASLLIIVGLMSIVAIVESVG